MINPINLIRYNSLVFVVSDKSEECDRSREMLRQYLFRRRPDTLVVIDPEAHTLRLAAKVTVNYGGGVVIFTDARGLGVVQEHCSDIDALAVIDLPRLAEDTASGEVAPWEQACKLELDCGHRDPSDPSWIADTIANLHIAAKARGVDFGDQLIQGLRYAFTEDAPDGEYPEESLKDHVNAQTLTFLRELTSQTKSLKS